jgi:hypothetical protein
MSRGNREREEKPLSPSKEDKMKCVYCEVKLPANQPSYTELCGYCEGQFENKRAPVHTCDESGPWACEHPYCQREAREMQEAEIRAETNIPQHLVW